MQTASQVGPHDLPKFQSDLTCQDLFAQNTTTFTGYLTVKNRQQVKRNLVWAPCIMSTITYFKRFEAQLLCFSL